MIIYKSNAEIFKDSAKVLITNPYHRENESVMVYTPFNKCYHTSHYMKPNNHTYVQWRIQEGSPEAPYLLTSCLLYTSRCV